MNVLLNSCCNLASLNIALPVEPFSLYSTDKSRALRQSVNQHLPVSNSKNGDKKEDNMDLALCLETSPIRIIIDKINDSIKHQLDDDDFEKPDSYDKDEDIRFLHKNKNFSEMCFCFNLNYFTQLIEEMKLEQKYDIGCFIVDCDTWGLLVRSKSEGRKQIKVRFDNGTNRLYALKAHDETGLLYTPNENQSIVSDLEKDYSTELPIS